MKRIVLLVLASLMVLSLVACGAKEDINAKSEGVMTYAEYAAAALESTVTIEAYVQAKQEYAAEYGNTSLYLQDGEGAYFVYRIACTQDEYDAIKVGNKVKVTGVKAEWSGEIEITEATLEIVDGKYVAEAKDVTALLGTDELVNSQNMFVSFKGMTVEASKDAEGNDVAFLYNWNGAGQEGDDLYFNVSVNGQTYNFTVETALCDANSDVYAAVKNLKIGDKIDLEGFLYWYNGANPHITSVTPAK